VGREALIKELTQLSNQEILQKATSFLYELNQRGVNYFLVGSLARRAYMGTLEKGGALTPEVDLIVLYKNDIEKIKKLKPPKIKLDLSLSGFIYRDKDGDYSLRFGNLKIPIKKEVFKPEIVKINGIDVFTLRPETLLHMYALVGGIFRPKDWVNAINFARWMKNKRITYDHELYLPFHRFNKRQLKNPLRKLRLFWREILRSLPPEALEGIEKVYNTSLMKKIRNFFNEIEKITFR